jgi:hypothetical protein
MNVRRQATPDDDRVVDRVREHHVLARRREDAQGQYGPRRVRWACEREQVDKARGIADLPRPVVWSDMASALPPAVRRTA